VQGGAPWEDPEARRIHMPLVAWTLVFKVFPRGHLSVQLAATKNKVLKRRCSFFMNSAWQHLSNVQREVNSV
jgi:hypothetical protein